jgi:hypothetical protein
VTVLLILVVLGAIGLATYVAARLTLEEQRTHPRT